MGGGGSLLRRDVPGFSLKAELRDPEMRRLMQLPGMRLGDAYRLAHYSDALRQTARTVEQGVVERIRQRASRPAENGTRPGSAAVTRADVASMTRAQREALERQALHGCKSSFNLSPLRSGFASALRSSPIRGAKNQCKRKFPLLKIIFVIQKGQTT